MTELCSEHKAVITLVKGARRRGRSELRELLRSNDAVLLSWAQATMGEAGIEAILFDSHTSIVEGSIGAIPRRLMVPTEDYERARRLLDEARGAIEGG